MTAGHPTLGGGGVSKVATNTAAMLASEAHAGVAGSGGLISSAAQRMGGGTAGAGAGTGARRGPSCKLSWVCA